MSNPSFFSQGLAPEEDERNGQQTSDLILEGGLHVPHPARPFRIYISPKNSSVHAIKLKIPLPKWAVKAHY